MEWDEHQPEENDDQVESIFDFESHEIQSNSKSSKKKYLNQLVLSMILVPLVLLVIVLVAQRDHRKTVLKDPVGLTVIFAAGGFLGAIMVGAFAIKDYVEMQIAEGESVPFPIRLLFGMGMFSIMKIWLPAIFCMIIGAIMFMFWLEFG